MNKILIANRDEFETKGIQWLIETSLSNVEVMVANHLDITIKMLENEAPDILIYELEMGSNEILDPLKKAVKINQPIILSLTIEATFEASKKAIDLGTKELLLKPFSPQELVTKLQQIVRELEQKRKFELTTQKTGRLDKIEYQHLFSPSDKSAENYVFMAFQPERLHVLSTLSHFLEDYLFPESAQLFVLNDMIIGIFKTTSTMNWEIISKRCMHDWESQFQEPICIIVNHENSGDLSIHDKFLHTKRMIEVTFFIGYRQVMVFDKQVIWEFIDPFLTPSEQRFWISSLNEGNKEEIREFLYREFLHITHPYPDPGLLRIRLTSILAQIRRHMKTFQLDKEPYEKEYLQMFDTILYESLIYRILQNLMIFSSKIIDAVVHMSPKHVEIIDKCIHYIEVNYWNQEIDLVELAKVTNRNPAYISHLFVERKNKTFREMLNEVRIREAKKLLLDTDMSIKEVSSLTGFQNQQYFSRVFKKWLGISPKEFRRGINEK